MIYFPFVTVTQAIGNIRLPFISGPLSVDQVWEATDSKRPKHTRSLSLGTPSFTFYPRPTSPSISTAPLLLKLAGTHAYTLDPASTSLSFMDLKAEQPVLRFAHTEIQGHLLIHFEGAREISQWQATNDEIKRLSQLLKERGLLTSSNETSECIAQPRIKKQTSVPNINVGLRDASWAAVDWLGSWTTWAPDVHHMALKHRSPSPSLLPSFAE